MIVILAKDNWILAKVLVLVPTDSNSTMALTHNMLLVYH